MAQQPTKRQRSRERELAERVIELAKQAKINCWNEFVEELQVPSELVPALLTMRTELIRLAPVRQLEPERVKALYTLIAALIDTNMALRQHAQHLREMTENWVGSIHGLINIADRIGRYAEFDHAAAAEDEDG